MRVVRLALYGMRLGAVGGALFGAAFGLFAFFLQHDPSQIVSTAIYFTKCGIAAGGLLGACGGFFERAEPVEPDYSPVQRTTVGRPVGRPPR